MVVFDTSVWIAYLDINDYRHQRAAKLYAGLQEDILVPEYVLCEVCSVLVAKKQKERAIQFIEIAEHNEHMELLPSSPQFFHEVREAFERAQTERLSFVGTALFVLARTHPVVTFDAALYKAIRKRSK